MRKAWINKPGEEWQLNTGVKYYSCTIPIDVAESLEIKPGDEVQLEIKDEKIIIKKLTKIK
jgi:AbrB family looped-hinge helix DNA binding protein